MAIEIRVPQLGESVSEATVARWMKRAGDTVELDEPLVELETDKVTVEVPAPEAGVIEEIVAEAGAEVEVGAVLGRIGAGNGVAAVPARRVPAGGADAASAAPSPAPEAAPPEPPLSPAVRKLVADHALDPTGMEGTGKGRAADQGRRSGPC